MYRSIAGPFPIESYTLLARNAHISHRLEVKKYFIRSETKRVRNIGHITGTPEYIGQSRSDQIRSLFHILDKSFGADASIISLIVQYDLNDLHDRS